jgi:hypothetical protein
VPQRGLLDLKIVDDRFQSVGRDFEARKRDRQLEAPVSGTAWIHLKQAVYGVDLRHVGMARHNDIDALSYGIYLQGVQVVQNVEQPFGEAHELRSRHGKLLGLGADDRAFRRAVSDYVSRKLA